jgi:hypothetical protein
MYGVPGRKPSTRRTTRSLVWRVNGLLAVVGTINLGVLALFLLFYGDPAGPEAPGTMRVWLTWTVDGHLEADIFTEWRRFEDQAKVANAIVPTLYPSFEPVDVTYPSNKGGTHHVSVRSTTATWPPDRPLTVDTADLSEAMASIGVRETSLRLDTPVVDSRLTTDIDPDHYMRGSIVWLHVSVERHPSFSIRLTPEPDGQIVPRSIVAAGALLAATGSVAVSVLARSRGWSERHTIGGFVTVAAVTAAMLLAQTVVNSPQDRDLLRLGWSASPSVYTAVELVPVAFGLFAGIWSCFGLAASAIRQITVRTPQHLAHPHRRNPPDAY